MCTCAYVHACTHKHTRTCTCELWRGGAWVIWGMGSYLDCEDKKSSPRKPPMNWDLRGGQACIGRVVPEEYAMQKEEHKERPVACEGIIDMKSATKPQKGQNEWRKHGIRLRQEADKGHNLSCGVCQEFGSNSRALSLIVHIRTGSCSFYFFIYFDVGKRKNLVFHLTKLMKGFRHGWINSAFLFGLILRQISLRYFRLKWSFFLRFWSPFLRFRERKRWSLSLRANVFS